MTLRLPGHEQTALTPLLAARAAEITFVLTKSPPQVNEPHDDSMRVTKRLVCILPKNLPGDLPWSAVKYASLVTMSLLPEIYF